MRLLAVFIVISSSLWAATSYPSQTCVLLDTAATTAVITNSGSAGGTETILFAPSGSERARFCFSPINVPPFDTETYTACADPCGTGATVSLMTADLGTGQFYRWGEYRDTSGNALSPRKTISKLVIPQREIAVITTSPLPMPREVIGQDNYATHVRANASAASGTIRLWLRINTTKFYNAKGSVQINGKKPSTGATGWDDITTSSATILDEWAHYGPLDHTPVRTLILTMAITSGVVTTGDNDFGFRMNLTDGITSGYRVLEFNVIEADKLLNSYSITSNVATLTANASHDYSSSNEVKIHGAPGIYGMLNGSRTITVTGGTTFTYVTCGTNPHLISCTSADGSGAPPVSSNTGVQPSPLMYAARQLISQSAFVWTDPTAWTAPAGSDAAAGKILWDTADMVVPNAPYIHNLQTGTCGTCHSATGLDLKLLNYSNYSIRARSMFHGLTAQQGDNIAAYIRTIDAPVPAMGRPWNPPYQPCPTLDAGSSWDWGAGGGIDCVNMYSSDWETYAAPGGSYTEWAYNQNFNMRETPIQWQLFDWNSWLPATYPQDTFLAASFEASSGFSLYTAFRAALVAGKQSGTINTSATTLLTTANFGCTTNDYLMIDDELVRATAGCGTSSLTITRAQGGTTAASHTSARIGDFTKYQSAGGGSGYGNGFGYNTAFIDYSAAISPNGTANLPQELIAGFVAPSPYILNWFSFKQWMLVKIWEVEHEFNLQPMLGQVMNAYFGACTTCPGGAYVTRGWFYPTLFNIAFHKAMTNSQVNTIDPISATGGIGFQCHSNIWYLAQEIVYAGNGNKIGDNPVDTPYTYGFLNGCGTQARPAGAMQSMPAIVDVQNSIQQTTAAGLMWLLGPSFVMDLGNATTELFMTSGQLTTHRTQLATMIKSIIDSQSTAAWQAEAGLSYMACTSNTTPAQYASSTRIVCDGIARILPMLDYYSVTDAIVDAIQAWAEAVWPAVNWAAERAASCTPIGTPAYPKCTNVP